MSIRKAALCAISLALTSCATPSSPDRLSPSLCTTVQRAPALPDGAGIVQPVTEEERSATRAFLNWVAEVVASDNRNADRAERAAKEGC